MEAEIVSWSVIATNSCPNSIALSINFSTVLVESLSRKLEKSV